MNRKFLSVVLSTVITATSCFSPLFSLGAGAVESDIAESQAITTNEVSEAADPVTLNFYSYIRDNDRTDVHLGYKMDQKTTIKANRGDDIQVKIKMKSTDEPYTSSLSLRYDLKESDNIEQLFGPGGDMEVPLGKNKAEFIGKYIPKREASLLEYNEDITFNPVIQEKIEKYWDDGDIFFDDGAFRMNDVPTWDAFGLVFSQFFSYESAEFKDMRERMHFTTTEGGDEYCTMSFHVSEDKSLGDEQTFVAYFPEFVRYAVSSGPHIYVDEMTMDITGSTYTEPTQPTTKPTAPPTQPPTQPPTEAATAIIHFADDNKREPMTVKVGDTFTYDIYLKLTDPKVQSYVTWTYFNQPVGTKKTPNQEGSIQIPEANQVLKVGRNGYTPHYSPFDESFDLMKFPNYLIGFGMGEMDSNGAYSMLNTKNGLFTQEGGCLVSTITFTVQKAGEVEVFTRLDDAIVDLDNGEIHAD
ncbi:MAG: hypothetical protein UD936_08300, partial [Acutalibacteraceae bacterium]|nr:hypothetical protein [Acutalibacteraceae bacterium]